MGKISKFSDEFERLANHHPYAKFILYATINNYKDPGVAYKLIEALFSEYVKLEDEKLKGTMFNLQHTTPKIELMFKDTPEQIKQQLIDSYFDAAYQAYNDQYGTWNTISKEEFLNNSNAYYDTQIIYLKKPL